VAVSACIAVMCRGLMPSASLLVQTLATHCQESTNPTANKMESECDMIDCLMISYKQLGSNDIPISVLPALLAHV